MHGDRGEGPRRLVSSRLTGDEQGRLFVELTTPGLGARRYRVVGDQVAAGGTAISFTGAKTGRRVERKSVVVE